MNRTRTLRLAALALAAMIVGCDNPPAPSPTPNPAPGPATKPAEGKAADAKPADVKPLDVAGTKLTDKQIAEINKIEPEADRKIALEQKLCPMTGAHLGAMGKPVKVMLKDQAVFLCCEGCEEEAKAKPEATLAKLGK